MNLTVRYVGGSPASDDRPPNVLANSSPSAPWRTPSPTAAVEPSPLAVSIPPPEEVPLGNTELGTGPEGGIVEPQPRHHFTREMQREARRGTRNRINAIISAGVQSSRNWIALFRVDDLNAKSDVSGNGADRQRPFRSCNDVRAKVERTRRYQVREDTLARSTAALALLQVLVGQPDRHAVAKRRRVRRRENCRFGVERPDRRAELICRQLVAEIEVQQRCAEDARFARGNTALAAVPVSKKFLE